MTDPTVPPSTPTILHLADRSRYERGLVDCGWARYLEYHSGPHGYGIVRKAQSLPLVTGTLVHEPIARILRHVQAGEPLDDAFVRQAIGLAKLAYTDGVTERGLATFMDDPTVQTLVEEQCALLGALTWLFVLNLLPWLLERYRILAVEEEQIAVLGCTCGLDGEVVDGLVHEQRGCQGIAWQSRPDVILESLTTGEHEYWEFKTLSQPSEPWESQWETKIQFALSILGVERKYGFRVDHNYVLGLIKGRREASYNVETGQYDGPLVQNSRLIYGYYKAGNPPLEAPDWQASYKWQDERGRNHTLGKAYRKTPIWTAKEFALEEGMSPVEYWVKWIGPEARAESLRLIGPLNRQDLLIAEASEEVLANELRWQEDLEHLRRLYLQHGWGSEAFMRQLRWMIPRSWDCRRYGKRHACQFEDLCFKRQGWEDPIGSGLYVERTPHHQLELDRAQAAGVPVSLQPSEASE